MVNYVTIATALILSVIAGYFSVVGLATIFSGAYYSVLLMAAALEIAKVVAVSWLTRNWDGCPKAIKYYLTSSVAVLMLITSMGTFGYLSKAYLETNTQIEQMRLQIAPLETQLSLAERKLRNAQTSLDALDRLVAQSDIQQANRIRNSQRSERAALATEISSASREVEMVSSKLLPLRSTKATTEAEIGPLKYVAEMIYGNSASTHFDAAVRGVIILLVIVFDPLAIVLLIAAQHGLKPKSRFAFNKATGKLEMKT